MNLFNAERSAYYKAKKLELTRKSESKRVVKQDALYVYHYGMTAYLELFPEAKEMGVSWHEELVEELENLRLRHLGQELSGYYMASAATKDKKANRKFRTLIKSMTSK